MEINSNIKRKQLNRSGPKYSYSITYKLKFRSDVSSEKGNIMGQVEITGRKYERITQHCLPHDSVHLAGAQTTYWTLGTSF